MISYCILLISDPYMYIAVIATDFVSMHITPNNVFDDYSFISTFNQPTTYSFEKIKLCNDTFLCFIKNYPNFLILMNRNDLKILKNSLSASYDFFDLLMPKILLVDFFVTTDIEFALKNELIVYLESNGCIVELGENNNNRQKRHVLIGKSVLLNMQILGCQNSLLKYLECQFLKHGSNKIKEELINLNCNSEVIRDRRDFCNYVIRNKNFSMICQILCKLKPFPDIKKEELLDSRNSFSESQFEKSIYSKQALNENSLRNYKKLVVDFLNLKSNVGVFKELLDYFLDVDSNVRDHFNNCLPDFIVEKIQFPDNSLERRTAHCNEPRDDNKKIPGILIALVDLLKSKGLRNTYELIHEISNYKNHRIKSLIENKLVNVVDDNIDQYLDLARNIYFTKLQELENEIWEITKISKFKISVGENNEIYIKQEYSSSKSKKNSCNGIDNNSNQSKSKSRSRYKFFDQLGLIKIKTIETGVLYSTNKVKKLNEILKDISNQIIEIQGRICKDILLKVQRFQYVLSSLYNIVEDAILCCSLISKRNNAHFTAFIHEDSKSIKIQDIYNFTIPSSVKTSYLFKEAGVKVITGNNMAGKSCYLRNLCHCIFINQIGGVVGEEPIEIPIFHEIYFINKLTDLIELDKNLGSLGQDIMDVYETPNRIVFIDELQCKEEVQLGLLNMLSKYKIYIFYITHNPKIIRNLESNGFSIFHFENYSLNPGVSLDSHAMNLCQSIFPTEFIENLKNNLKYNEDSPSHLNNV